MSSDRIHRAAKDGLLDVLKEATRSEANSKDSDGMTPVLWAAFEGRLEALKLLVGRGGDPDKSDQFGNSALHLAAAKGHMSCVDFLVQFGVNLYALDIDNHSAQDLAAINNRDAILRYLDAASANLEAVDKRKVRELKEHAKKKSEKRAREFNRRQQKLEQGYDEDTRVRPHRPSNMLQMIKHKIWSGSQGNLKASQKDNVNGNSTKFSALVGGTVSGSRGAVKKRAEASKLKHQMENGAFKIGEVEPTGKRSIRSIQGMQRDSEILYVGTYNSADDNSNRGKIKDVFEVDSHAYEDMDDEDSGSGGSNTKFNTMTRSVSQPDFLANLNDDLTNDVLLQNRPSLFNRPSGNLAMTRSVSTVLAQLGNEHSANESSDGSTKRKLKHGPIKPRTQLVISDSDSDQDSSDNDENESLAILRFLAAFKLEDYYPIMQKNEIDMETLMLLTEGDIKSLGLPLGIYRRLCNAIQERKEALASPGTIMDSRL
ncbi:pre-mRNA splicing regulator USH1G [Toxorhynchites rutilus septentrionalis]|uniref:pre-mRNA splicing regulator USH1G n=1 Tax=Toxorhynchites rutilus septentrionalis TaxID=329112 RepID=UPI00247ACE43|nr:pre-mRNA splicing regulator USH1G [Toxorhynchites rutilus septentrionalis]XP_055623212.1 pre-mRNA splicing regulator USH1G [Toxorhynchites rutilus septentrionalis]XP_055623213.1 pre-mRNA splicing regulator USH1G [Toxorhynchites rutilus septentrionalis]XP_055623214.1 pre-mRNA splicing regulator USH1G [Toxorhynchites rutilus septentrionalis]XP_055623215.1 pre-mRNA splicing regulator USH1G [Toxorhynchites rutilus septentrionalis]XP_055623216.1 pre-mRNA splicing regulator USH1G [Toxorhynchites 